MFFTISKLDFHVHVHPRHGGLLFELGHLVDGGEMVRDGGI
jgi:hypothetical protein